MRSSSSPCSISLPRWRNRRAGQVVQQLLRGRVAHAVGGIEQYLLLRAPNLGRDDADCQILLLTADEAGDAIPAARRALVGIIVLTRCPIAGRNVNADENRHPRR